MHNHAYSRSKAIYSGYDFNGSAPYNDYATKVGAGTDLLIVDEFKGDGVTEINRAEDKANGTVYMMNNACSFKLSGKEKPITLPNNLKGTKHDNGAGAPWWVAQQKANTNPTYIDLVIDYNFIKADVYEITNVIQYDQYKNTIINTDLSTFGATKIDTVTINYSERNK